MALVRSSAQLLRDAELGAATTAAKLARVEADYTAHSELFVSLNDSHATLESDHNALLASSVVLSDDLAAAKLECATATSGLLASHEESDSSFGGVSRGAGDGVPPGNPYSFSQNTILKLSPVVSCSQNTFLTEYSFSCRQNLLKQW